MRHGLKLPATSPQHRIQQRLANIEKAPTDWRQTGKDNLLKYADGTSDWDVGSGAWVAIPEMTIYSVPVPIGCGVRLLCNFGYNWTIAQGIVTFRFLRSVAGAGLWNVCSRNALYAYTNVQTASTSEYAEFTDLDQPPTAGNWDYQAQLFQSAAGLVHAHAATNSYEKRLMTAEVVHIG